jgi:hypothetical protein
MGSYYVSRIINEYYLFYNHNFKVSTSNGVYEINVSASLKKII